MNGVTILNTIDTSGDIILIVVLLVMMIVSVAELWGATLKKKVETISTIITAFFTTLCLVVFTAGVVTCVDLGCRVRHEALISEDVNMLEFNEKYEILEHNGDVYVIVEKEITE